MNTQNNTYGDLSTAGEVRLIRILPGPIERVWAFLTDPEKRSLWLASGRTDLRVGGEVHLEFHNAKLSTEGDVIPEKYQEVGRDGCNFTGKILRCEPPHVYSHTWGGTDSSASEVTFELTAQGDEVRMLLTHRKLGDDHDGLLSVSAGWHTHVDILLANLGGWQAPTFWATHTRLEQEYEKLLS